MRSVDRRRTCCFCSFLFLLCTHVCAEPTVVRVGMYENHPKIFTAPDGTATGFFPALLDHIAREEEWQVNYVSGSWQNGLDRLASGELDLMPDVAITPERERLFDFTEETVLISWAVIYTRPELTVQSFFDLEGLRIALLKGSVYAEGNDSLPAILERFGIRADFLELASYQEVFDAVQKRSADAGVVNNIFGSSFEKDYSVQRSPVLFSPSQLHFAVRKGAPHGNQLKEVLDRHLRRAKQDPRSYYYQAMDRHLFGTLPAPLQGEPANWKAILSPEEQAWLKNHPVIRLGIDPEFYPFEFRGERGAYQGIASDYVKLFNERLGLNMTVLDRPAWTGTVADVQRGLIDVLPCVGITAERSRYLLFSKPYIRFQRVILTRVDMPFISDLSDIEHLRVGVQADTSHEGFLRENTTLSPTTYPSLEKCLLALSGGSVDAVVANLSSSAHLIRKLNLINLKAAAPASPEIFTLHFAVRKDWPQLLSIINKALDLVSPDQQRDMEQRWVAVEYKPGIEPRVAWRVGLRIALLVLLVFAVILAWTLRLKREIAHRKRIGKQLDFRERFERLVSETSSRFVALEPAQVDQHIRVALAEVVCFTDAVAAYLFTYDDNGKPLCTHQAGDLETLHRAGLHRYPGPREAHWLDQLLQREPVMTALNDLPPFERIMEIPFTGENQTPGFIGLLGAKATGAEWRQEDISLLQLLGQLLSGALQRKDMEESMKQYAEQLETANRRLQELDRLKNMFIASVSHELRTPLNSIIGFTGVILKGMAGPLNERQQDQLNRVYASARHLLALITDIIDISKIEAGRVDVFPQPFLLEEVVQEAIESIRPLLQAKPLQLETDIQSGIHVCTDRKRLRQCLLNYLSNAVKYSEEGTIRVTARDNGDRFELAVSDTGIGMDQDEQKRLFEPFVRLDSQLRIKAGGTGLGLYLTRKIVTEILHGTLAVTSEKGVGSTFSLRAPKTISPEETLTPEEKVNPS